MQASNSKQYSDFVLEEVEEDGLDCTDEGPDASVIEEVRRCEVEPAMTDSIRLQHLTKVYHSQPSKVILPCH